eukprot:6316225-Prymnesium_polylepis.1
MPHDCHPRCLQRTSPTHRVSPPPRSPDACAGMPRRRLAARTFACRPASATRVLPACAQSRPRDDPG